MKRATISALPHDALPLRTVAAMTGLSPDIIRAWEKRYAVVAPIRGARGARLYSAADIAHLRLLARAVGAGRAIGDVAGMSRAQLEGLEASPGPQAGERRDGFVGRLIEHLERFDRVALARVLGDALTGLGTRAFVHEVAVPLLQEVGDRWRTGSLSIADEHLLSAMVRNLVASLIQTRTAAGRPTAVFATPAGERHEFGVLLISLLALDAGVDVAQLGADLPAAEILAAVRRSDAVLLGISVVGKDNRPQAVRELTLMHRNLPAQVELWLGGRDAAAVAAAVKSFRGMVVDSPARAESELARIGGRVCYGMGASMAHDRAARAGSVKP